ncbi:hypothetical protein B0H14DRAFT_3469621 [Mycena olivaceomarginata]|nr:hypothetical protein B0H14DRAFT_3469621 [Mycena olivaceomarginata]
MEVEQCDPDLNNRIKFLQSPTRGCLKCSDTASLSFEIWPWLAAHIGIFCLLVVLVFIICKAFEPAALVSAQDTDPVVLYHPTTLAPIFLSGAPLIQHLHSGYLGVHNRYEFKTTSSITTASSFNVQSHRTSTTLRLQCPSLEFSFSIRLSQKLESSPIVISTLDFRYSAVLAQIQRQSKLITVRHLAKFMTWAKPPKTITPIMSHSRDNPGPRLIVNGPRQRKQAPMLSDPNNDETEIAAMEAFVEQIDKLTRKLPSSIPIAALVKYLKTVPWAELQCSIVRPKLERIIRELEFLCSNPPASSKPKSKRKSSEPTNDAEDLPKAKRIRSTTNTSVTLDEVPDENALDFQPKIGDDHIFVNDSSGDESDATQCKTLAIRAEKAREETCKNNGITKQADQRRQKCCSTSPRPDVIGEDGMLADIDVQLLVQPEIRSNPSADVFHFSAPKTAHGGNWDCFQSFKHVRSMSSSFDDGGNIW